MRWLDGPDFLAKNLPLPESSVEDVRLPEETSDARSDLWYGMKHPIILPHAHPISTLVIGHYHKLTSHQGRHVTLSAIRNAGFFLEQGAKQVRQFIKACLTCQKIRAPLETQQMAELPLDRLEVAAPFSNVGLDVMDDPNDPLPLAPSLLLTMKAAQPASAPDSEPQDLIAIGPRQWRRVKSAAIRAIVTKNPEITSRIYERPIGELVLLEATPV
ncbi:hypothetical protein HAZT_HAZT009443 [Hyalella azteca]|uniref:Integrase zinc-binding domain-containing protein n=1 Tax=Hyalella azteca TaxID=294128 RepID=A0A6A0H022_HYAAZ|nr:hypothetical protein HAZT_HAZT009443 [Hyalella azteca]